MDAQVPALLDQAFQSYLHPADGSPPPHSFIRDLKLVNFKLGNSPPQVHSVSIPEGLDDGHLPPGDLIVDSNYTFDSDDLDVSVLLGMSRSELRGNLAESGVDASHTLVASGEHAGATGAGVVIKVGKIKFDACLRFRVRPEAQMCFVALTRAPEVELDLTATFKTVRAARRRPRSRRTAVVARAPDARARRTRASRSPASRSRSS